MKYRLFLFFIFVLFNSYSQEKISNDNELEAFKVAYNAYIWGYPLVARAVSCQNENTSFNVLKTIDNKFAQTVKGSADVYFLRADLDLSQGEILLTIPTNTTKYYSLMLSDAYAHVFGNVSSLKNTSKDPKVLIVGPSWQGTLPKGVKNVLKCSTNYAWLIVRTSIDDNLDFENTKKLFLGFNMSLVPNNKNIKPWAERLQFVKPKLTLPVNDQIQAMDWKTYFNYLSKMMRDNPWPASQNEDVLAFDRIGLNNRKDFDGSGNRAKAQKGIKQGIIDAKELLKKELQSKADFYKNGWSVNINEGKWGNMHARNAASAYNGFNQTPAEELSKLETTTDKDGTDLDGSKHSYSLTFPKGQAPANKGYWTVGVYSIQNTLIENAKNKYAINSKSKTLKPNKDGSLTLFFQNTAPAKGFEANVIPIPEGFFKVIIKVIAPDEIVKSGEWIPSGLVAK